MFIKFIRPGIFAFFICFFCFVISFAQKGRITTVNQQFKSASVTIDRFEWAFDDSLKKTSEAKITVTNNSQLAIKSLTLLLIGQSKAGIMLQSGSTHTLKRKTASERIIPGETKTIVLPKAFNNPQLYTLTLKEVTIEYENGSLEMFN